MKTARYFYKDKELKNHCIEKQFSDDIKDTEILKSLENECISQNDYYTLILGEVLI